LLTLLPLLLPPLRLRPNAAAAALDLFPRGSHHHHQEQRHLHRLLLLLAMELLFPSPPPRHTTNPRHQHQHLHELLLLLLLPSDHLKPLLPCSIPRPRHPHQQHQVPLLPLLMSMLTNGCPVPRALLLAALQLLLVTLWH
jgi:hypothetical protein